MLSFLEYIFSSKTVLFLGFGLRDLNTNSLLYWTNKTLKNHKRKSYSITNSINEYYKKLLDQRGIIVIENSAQNFLNDLADELGINVAGVTNELEFSPKFEPFKISKGENSKMIFQFTNNLSENIQCISYRFETYFKKELLVNFKKHAFSLKVPAGETKTREFGTVNPLSAYFGNKQNSGEYLAKIFIEYEVCSESTDSEHLVKNLIGNANLIVQ